MALNVLRRSSQAEARNGVAADTAPRNFPLQLAVRTGIACILAGLAMAAYFVFAQPNSQDKVLASAAPAPVVTVTTSKATYQTVQDTITVTGSVCARDPLTIGTESSGLKIQSVNVEEGDYVKKGQVLAVLDNGTLKAQLKQAKAQLDSSQASLRKSIQPNRPEEIQALRAALAQAQANTAQEQAHTKEAKVNYDNALLNAHRYRRLAQVGAVSFQDAETKEVAADTAHEEYLSAQEKVKAASSAADGARQKLLEAESGGRSEDVEMAKASIAEHKAQVEQLEDEIAQTYIAAPDDGQISSRDAHIGDIASVSKPLFTMIRANKLELKAQATDMDLAKFQAGQSVNVSLSEDAPHTVPGKVWLVSPQVDQSTRLGMVRIDLPANSGLKPGMFVRGEVQLGKHRALTVPMQAIVTRNGQSYVYTLNGNRVLARAVSLGMQTDTFAEVTSGLKPEQTVVVKGARFLSDSDVVRVENGSRPG